MLHLAALLLCAMPVQSQSPTWAPGFGSPGTPSPVVDFATFDDGQGPALYLAGKFAAAGEAIVSGIARWDASGFSAPPSGPDLVAGHQVVRLRTLDLGAGPRLVALGNFGSVAGDPARCVAVFDGQQWSALGGGPPVVAPFTALTLHAAAVYDEGQGPQLFVGGTVVDAEWTDARKPYLARWDGATWTTITDGPTDYLFCGFSCDPHGVITTLEVLDEAGGPALYVGGNFALPGTPIGWNLARWDGATWSAPGGVGLGNSSSSVDEMVVHDDGSGPALYLVGLLGTSSPNPNFVRWNGQAFDVPNQGLLGSILHLRSLPAAGGHPAGLWGMPNRPPTATQILALQRWDGTQWNQEPLHLEYYAEAYALGALDTPEGSLLFLGGGFRGAAGQVAANVVAFDGNAWGPLASGLGWSSDSLDPGFVSSLAVHDDGDGPKLYAGGEFSASGGTTFSNLARWDGSSWEPIEGMLLPGLHHVDALLSLDIGAGPELWLAGDLKFPNLNPLAVARWNGATFDPLETTMSAEARALAAFDDGLGTRPYVAISAGVRRWNGSNGFSTIGSATGGVVYALAVHDDGSGPSLYAGGSFTNFAGQPALHVARWDGASWHPVGGGLGGVTSSESVRALLSFDDGHGSKLYAGGTFASAGGAPASNVAVWDGQNWQTLGTGVAGPSAVVLALAVFDGGYETGRDLYVGGRFSSAGGQPAANLARWNGTSWSASGLGTVGLETKPDVRALLAADLPALGGRTLSVGGNFDAAGGVAATRYARLGACDVIGEIFCLGDGTEGACPCANEGLPGHGCENSASIRGAELFAFGSSEQDSVVLDVGFLPPTALAIFLQGSSVLGAPTVFGDGLRCIGGSLKRLYVENAVGGHVSEPDAGDPSIGERSAALGDPLEAGSVRGYQVYYRDPSALFCPEPQGSTFNISNGTLLVW